MQNDEHVLRELHGLRHTMKEMMVQGGDWEAFTLRVFRFQASHNPTYRRYVELRGVRPEHVKSVQDIPFLPVEFFQSHRISVFSESYVMPLVFRSSGTTGQRPSQHFVDDAQWYHHVTTTGYRALFGSFDQAIFFGVLPGYLERADASLVHMARDFMLLAGQSQPANDFFKKDFSQLEARLDVLNAESAHPTEVVIVGVTHALLEWSNRSSSRANRWPNLTVRIVETGGMKGHGRERIREEVHAALAPLSSNGLISSEYGMTELLSQAWSKANGVFQAPPWMRVYFGSLNDPGSWVSAGRQGRIHVMDLANLASCAFLATGDIGRGHADGAFEVLGRFDHAEVRGCNLMSFE